MRDDDEAGRLRIEAQNLDRRADRHREDRPHYAEHLARRADHCRRLARDADRDE